MAYFDTDKTADTAAAVRDEFYRLVKSIAATPTKARMSGSRSPEDILAAQTRAEAHRRKVDRLFR